MTQVLHYLNKIIVSENLPEECYSEALKSVKVWLKYATSTFIPHEELISNLFKLLSNEKV